MPASEVKAELGTEPSSPEGIPGDKPGDSDRDSWEGLVVSYKFSSKRVF